MSDSTNNVKLDVIQAFNAAFSTRLYVTKEPMQAQARIAEAVAEIKTATGTDVEMYSWNRVCGFFQGAPRTMPAPDLSNQIEIGINAMIKDADGISKIHQELVPPAERAIEVPYDPVKPIIFVIHEADAIIGGERNGNGSIITLIRSFINCNMNSTLYAHEENGDVVVDGDTGKPIVLRGKRMLVFLSNGGRLGDFIPEMKPTHVSLPGLEAMRDAVLNVFEPLDSQYKKDRKKGHPMPKPEIIDVIAGAATGMTYQDAEDAISRAWSQTRSLTPQEPFLEVIEGEKARIIRGMPGITYMPKSSLPTHALPGYEKVDMILKDYLNVPAEEAKKKKLPRLKGFLLIGPPGTGKTEFAKTVARATGRFPMTMNLGEIQGGVIGQSERQMREALDVIRIMKPVVLVDEVDKMGVNMAESGHTGDGGVFGRLIGMLHTEMTDPNHEAIFILTANNLVSPEGKPIIPASLIRAGRIDERFFVENPDDDTRRRIFAVRAQLHDMEFDNEKNLAALIRDTDQWVGAEIANLVQRGVRRALSNRAKKIDTASMIEYVSVTQPLLKQGSYAASFQKQYDACKEFTFVGRKEATAKAKEAVQQIRAKREV